MALTLGPPSPSLSVMANPWRYALVGNQLNPAFQAMQLDYKCFESKNWTLIMDIVELVEYVRIPFGYATSQASFIKVD